MMHDQRWLRNKRRQAVGCLAVALITCLSLLSAQASAYEPPDDELKAQILGSLLHTRVDVDLADCPSHDALKQLSRAIGWTMIDYWSDEAFGAFDLTSSKVNLQARDISAHLVLEIIAAQVASGEPITWQIGKGVIEFGPKQMLASRSRIEQRSYDLSDVTIDIPYFQAGIDGPATRPPDTTAFNKHRYRPASLMCGPVTARKGQLDSYSVRQKAEDTLASMMRGIVELIEPGNWDFGDELKEALPGNERLEPTNNLTALTRPARIRHLRESTVLVAAPDFVHRALGGYPAPTPPSPELVEDLITRPRTGTKGATITFARIADLDESDEPRPAERVNDRSPLLDHLTEADESRLRLARALENRVISTTFDGTHLSEVIHRVEQLSGVPIVGRFASDGGPWGMLSQTPIYLEVRRSSARSVIEAVLQQVGHMEGDCTWQIRPGFVEVGTKRRLSVSAARELRIYPAKDLMMVIPDSTVRGREMSNRQIPELGALELVDTVVTLVEPGAWDWGQPIEPEFEHGLEAAPRKSGSQRTDAARNGPGPEMIWAPVSTTYVDHPRPAVIRTWQGKLFVAAPDYIHRQIGGYSRTVERE